jgi:predicted ABC-class ATPase
MEMGSQLLLIDEDTCATNFMIRDEKMIQLVSADREPITPFVRVVRNLYEQHKISTILVIGGTGDYFAVADHVFLMDHYQCTDVTARAKEIVAQSPATSTQIDALEHGSLQAARKRHIQSSLLEPRGSGKVRVPSKKVISYGDTEIGLDGVEQIVSAGQTHSISAILRQVSAWTVGSNSPTELCDVVRVMDSSIASKGLESALADGQFHGGLVRPRVFEIAAAFNRLRHAGAVIQATDNYS